jgi:hypothetical protein
VTALAKSRSIKVVVLNGASMLSTAETVYQNGICCIDTSTGLLKKATASTTLIPIGLYEEDTIVASGGKASVKFMKEIAGAWFGNSASGDAIAQANVGSTVYLVDDQTVALTSNSGARSAAGIALFVDSVKGVFVKFGTSF